MILPSEVPSTARTYILNRLHDLAAKEGVRILLAVESGSRAWGFPSADSDYDVRFIYARPRSDYLSVQTFRDVIETPLVDDPLLGVPFDLNGWDIRKALRLGLSSNPVLHEWLTSPIVYMRDDDAMTPVHDLVRRAADAAAFRYHYDRLCRSAWNQMQTQDGASVKRYCYALRPALMLHWLSSRDDLPPMDVHDLCTNLNLEADVLGKLADLIRLKSHGDERDPVASADALNAYITSQLANMAARPEKSDAPHGLLAQADAAFLNVLDRDAS